MDAASSYYTSKLSGSEWCFIRQVPSTRMVFLFQDDNAGIVDSVESNDMSVALSWFNI
jgi:hypothetical protein